MLLDKLEQSIDMTVDDVLEIVEPQNYLYFKEKQEDAHQYVLAHRDNGSRVLGVVHLDTVIQESEFAVGRSRIYGSKFDDRLGLYTLLYHLPQKFGISLDLLLCDNEEKGASTARYWDRVVSKEYNWIVEFDRPGTDNVCYQFTSPKWCERWENFGFHFGIGSYTDIVEMDNAGVKAINVGVGYYSSHQINSYMTPAFYTKQIERFSRFYDQFAERRFPHSPVGEWQNEASATDYEFHNWMYEAVAEKKIKPTEINSLAWLQKYYRDNFKSEKSENETEPEG